MNDEQLLAPFSPDQRAALRVLRSRILSLVPNPLLGDMYAAEPLHLAYTPYTFPKTADVRIAFGGQEYKRLRFWRWLVSTGRMTP